MIVRLDVPFTDTSVSGLQYLSSAPALPVLAELDHRDLVPDGHLSLRLLGASHQAVLSLPHGQYAETLACLDSQGGTPPAQRTVTVGEWQFRLRVTIDRASPEDLASACREMRDIADRDDPRGSLYASFPGHPQAATFLQVQPTRGRVGHSLPPGWTTVHIYPESGERVRTCTDVRAIRTTAGRGTSRPRLLREKV